MIIKIKNAIFDNKKAIVSVIMALFVVVAVIGEVIIPKSGKALGFCSEPYDFNLAIVQENSLIATNNPVETQSIKKVKMIITAYSSTPEETDETPFITASGTYVKDGIVANNKYPFGTKIRIPELYGSKVFIVEDRMHREKGGYQLDIWFPDYSTAKQFGAKLTYVEILKN